MENQIKKTTDPVLGFMWIDDFIAQAPPRAAASLMSLRRQLVRALEAHMPIEVEINDYTPGISITVTNTHIDQSVWMHLSIFKLKRRSLKTTGLKFYGGIKPRKLETLGDVFSYLGMEIESAVRLNAKKLSQ